MLLRISVERQLSGNSAAEQGVSPRTQAVIANIISGLPPYGPMAIAFPHDWGCLGREGIVVEFQTEAGAWVGNFQPGLGGLDCAGIHPDGRHAVVISTGDLWVVDPNDRTGQLLLPAIEAAFEVHDPEGEKK
jgi:hypothetical protein